MFLFLMHLETKNFIENPRQSDYDKRQYLFLERGFTIWGLSLILLTVLAISIVSTFHDSLFNQGFDAGRSTQAPISYAQGRHDQKQSDSKVTGRPRD